MGWTTPAEVRAENPLLKDVHGWDDKVIQNHIEFVTRRIKFLLSQAWATYLTSSKWLANEPESVPPILRDICLQWTVGKCLLAAYGNVPDRAEEAYITMSEARRMIVGVNIGRTGEILGINQLLQIEGADGVMCTGQGDMIGTSPYPTSASDDDFHDLSSADLDAADQVSRC